MNKFEFYFIPVVFLVSIVIVYIVPFFLKKKQFKGRSVDNIRALYEINSKDLGVSYEDYCVVINLIAIHYGINRSNIRLYDSFSDYEKFDSWRLWKGKEAMDQWILDELNLNPEEQNIMTVRDLVVLFAKFKSS